MGDILAKDVTEGMNSIYGKVVDVVCNNDYEVVCNIDTSNGSDEPDQFIFDPEDVIS